MYCVACGQLVQDLDMIGAQTTATNSRVEIPLPTPFAGTAVGTTQPPAPMTASAVQAIELQFSTGVTVLVQSVAVIGRNPTQSAMNAGAQAIAITDDSRSVSRVHLTLELNAGHVFVTDAGSSNGSAIVRGPRTLPLAEGVPTEALPGDVVWIGDVSFTMTAR